MKGLCTFERIGDGTQKSHAYRCRYCKYEIQSNYPPARIHQECRQPQTGNVLHGLIKKSLGIKPNARCHCNARRSEMNRKGVAWCRENIDYLVDAMLEEAQRRKWHIEGKPLLSAAAKVGTMTALGRAFARRWAASLVREALKICEKAALDNESQIPTIPK